MSSTPPEENLTPDESERLARSEATLQQGLAAYAQVAAALAEIRDQHLYRDTHASFETYLRERWGFSLAAGELPSQAPVPADERPLPAVRSKPCEALARACEQTLSALANDERMAVELQLAIRRQHDRDPLQDARTLDPWAVASLADDDILATLRWLLTQAGGTVADVAHRLESRAVDIDDRAREQLADDILVLDDELNAVKSLLLGAIDWDSELERLLKGEIPPPEDDTDAEGDG